MQENKKLAKQPRIVIKKSDEVRKMDRESRKAMNARLAELNSRTLLVNTKGFIDWPESSKIVFAKDV